MASMQLTRFLLEMLNGFADGSFLVFLCLLLQSLCACLPCYLHTLIAIGLWFSLHKAARHSSFAIPHDDQRGHTTYHIPGFAVHVLQEHDVLLPAHDNGKELAHPITTLTLLQLDGVSKEGAALLDSVPQEENTFLLDDGRVPFFK